MPDDGDLTLTVNSQRLNGWTSVRVTAGVERCPRDFEIGMTERYPGEFSSVIVRPGDPCEVRIGGDLVVTGYVDRFMPVLDAGQHAIQVAGRGTCGDLVDCAAQWPSNQVVNATILSLATKLAAPYGIQVEAIGDMGEPVPQINIIWGETAYSVIERVARYEAILVYESPEGKLVLAPIGSASHASGFAQGKNVQRAAPFFSCDQRYSEYVVRTLAFDLNDIAGTGDILETVVDDAMAALKRRDGSPRERVRYIIAEQGDYYSWPITKKRGQWEAARRAGRSFRVELTADSWRDSAGKLWTPNQFAQVELPALKLPSVNWLIGEVSFIRDAQGTRADVTLMPPDAFKPEPFLLQPLLPDVQ
ncbi:MAG: hypothetical protein KGJ66_04235 [Alphaproteobacteria bacterium]|nr:hypothetical protein [Alphaproteobacteria bacterium]